MALWRYLNERTGAVTLSLISNSVLILLKIVVGLYTGSISLISEAIHSSTDLAAALIAFFAIRTAARPADQNHPYGHGKAESISAAVEALLIFVAAGLIVYEAIQRLYHGAPIENLEWGIGVMLFSAAANFVVSRHLFKVSKRTESPALAADAWHLATDLYTALGVALGLLLVRLTGLSAFDPLVAIGVALFIVRAGWNITRGSVADLMDESLPATDEARIREILEAHRGSFSRVRTLRSRRSGSHRHAYIALEFPPGVSLAEAHELTADLERDIGQAFPDVTIVVEAEPPAEHRETPATIVEDVERLAHKLGLSIDQVNVSRGDKGWNLSLDLVGQELSAARARAMTTEFEDELRRENAELDGVDVQIEPRGVDRATLPEKQEAQWTGRPAEPGSRSER